VADYDAVIVGSGINSLACAALLARAGWRVCVLEREAELGGAIKTVELTEPGFQHDVFSAWHPLWVGGAAHALLGEELAQRGLEYLNTEHPTGTLYPDGESAFLTTSTDGNAAELERHAAGDGDAWRATIDGFGAEAELAFGVLGTELWSGAGAALLLKGTGASDVAASPRSAASSSSRVGTAWSRRSTRSGRTACSRPGYFTPASALTRPRPAS